MPIVNLTTGQHFSLHLHQAHRFFSRLIGLLGTEKPDYGKCLHIIPCTSVHTFGMKYPIDILFLDRHDCVVKCVSRQKPNRIVQSPRSTKSVLELPSGFIEENGILKNHKLDVTSDSVHRPKISALKNIFHWPLNIMMALLWSRFVLKSLETWLVSEGPLEFGILIHNSLLLSLFLIRRKSKQISENLLDWVIPILTLTSTLLLNPQQTGNNTCALMSLIIQCLGMTGIILSLASLGRSFGIIPANRQIQSSGMYRIVRHPLYASELIFYTGFLISHFNLMNGILILFILAGQIFRSHAEERLLLQDGGYLDYLNKIHYRLIPGVY